MDINRNSRILAIFLAGWTVLNLLQAGFTELIHDEAYYWFYTLHLSWGYFDHPPMVAWMIWPGAQMLGGEIGVRLLAVLVSTASLWLIWKLIRPQRSLLLGALISGTMIMHVGGFIAAPDIPMVFFSAVYLLSLQCYIKEDRWLYAAGMFIGLAGMAYSKYNGALLFAFTILPNLFLLKRNSFWLVILAVITSLIPHFLWQYEHNFATFRYHFMDRDQFPWEWKYFFRYPIEQFIVYGPFLGFILFPAAFAKRAHSSFERGLKWAVYGIFGFFLLRSFSGPVEANWTVSAIIPLIYLSYKFLEARPAWKKWVFILSIPSLLVILALRLFLAYDYLPEDVAGRNETHGWSQWATELEEKAGELPVLFHNSYSLPSKYMFYTGRFAHSANDFTYAGKQYDLLPEVEASLQSKTVFYIKPGHPGSESMSITNKDNWHYHIDSSLIYYNRIDILIPERKYELPPDTVIETEFALHNPTADTVRFYLGKNLPSIQYCLFWYGKPEYCEQATDRFPVRLLAPSETRKFKARIQSPENDGDHWRFRMAIKSEDLIGRNSPFTPIAISK